MTEKERDNLLLYIQDTIGEMQKEAKVRDSLIMSIATTVNSLTMKVDNLDNKRLKA